MDGDLAAAIALLRQGDAFSALAPLRRASGAEPLARLNLGLALMDLGRLEEAEAELGMLHAAGACDPVLELRLGLLAARRGAVASARAHLEAALALDPSSCPAHVALARLCDDAEDAAAMLDRALAALPGNADLLLERAALRKDAAAMRALLTELPESGRLGRLLARAEIAVGVIPPAPGGASGCAEAVAAAMHAAAAGDDAGATALWRLATLLNPSDATAAAGLAESHHGAGAWAEAAEAFPAAIRLRPDSVGLRIGHADALYRCHRLAEAADAYRAAIRDLGPDEGMRLNLAMVLAAQGRQEESLALAHGLPPGPQRDLHLLAALGPYAEGGAGAATLAGHARSLHRHWSPEGAAPPPRRPAGGRRLRVGVLSPGLGRHPVGWLGLAGLEQLPAHGFDLVMASLRRHDDPLARRFRAAAAEWHDLPAGLDDRALADRLRALDLDILLEMGGHGEGGRAAALRFRPAPAQVKWVGAQSASTGVPGIGWMLTDARETPAGFEAFYTERLLTLPDGYVCYEAPPYAPEAGPLPALARGYVTFGCFNNLHKVTQATRRAWGAILRAVPGARLRLHTHALGDAPTRAAFADLCTADGIPADALELHGPLTHERLLAAYREVDVSLDAFPYSGGLTVCESLWMGVPVVALAGAHFAGRHALSHLTSLGMADWCAADVDGYVARALTAVGDLPALAATRAGLRGLMRGSPLMDAPRFGANLAAALRHALEEA